MLQQERRSCLGHIQHTSQAAAQRLMQQLLTLLLQLLQPQRRGL
jgi:hypothetical protein